MKGLVEERELFGEDGNEEGEGIGDILVVGIVGDGDVEMGGGGNGCATRGDGDMDGEGVRDGDKMPTGMGRGCKEAWMMRNVWKMDKGMWKEMSRGRVASFEKKEE